MAELVLVNPNKRKPAPFAATEPPLWAGLIAGHCLLQGRSVAIVDAEAEGFSVEQTVSAVKAYEPRDIMIVCMGTNPSVSSTPKWGVTQELLKHLPQAKVTGIHPLAIHHARAVPFQPDALPSVPWGLLPMEKYRAHNWHCLDNMDKRSPYGVLYTSLNCPYDCYYCNIHTIYGDRKVRYRDMRCIFDELRLFARASIRNIKVWDELFTCDAMRVIRICEHIRQQEYDFNLWAYARLDSVTPMLLRCMKLAGVNWLAYGFESVRDKKCLSRAHQVSQMTRDAGINIIGNFMFGLPGESRSDWRASLDMACEENLEYVNFSVALPYPGSRWYEDVKGNMRGDESFDQFSSGMIGWGDVVKFRDGAFDMYFRRPEYEAMVERKFGPKALDHIKVMRDWRIRQEVMA